MNQGVNGAQSPAKVAVLGGGVGGLTAAFELTATPQLRERYEVTVYQLGWRVGGKGASGRNAPSRTESRNMGLHVWFGFYDNALPCATPTTPSGARRASRWPRSRRSRPATRPCCSTARTRLAPAQLDCPRNLVRPGEAAELPTFLGDGRHGVPLRSRRLCAISTTRCRPSPTNPT